MDKEPVILNPFTPATNQILNSAKLSIADKNFESMELTLTALKIINELKDKYTAAGAYVILASSFASLHTVFCEYVKTTTGVDLEKTINTKMSEN